MSPCVQLCCCECPLDLGCIDTCSPFDTGQVATIAGKHTLVYKFNGAWLKLEGPEIEVDDPIKFDIKDLITEYVYEAQILNPNDEYICPEDDLMEYDCIRFKTVLTLIHP